MTRRVQPDHAGTAAARDSLRPLPGTRETQAKRVTHAFCGWVLFLLLAWASAAPAHATGGTISTAVDGPIDAVPGGGSGAVVVNSGGTRIIAGGSVSGAGGCGVVLLGGTLNMSGGSVSGLHVALQVSAGCTGTISGGSVSGTLLANGGTL